jgi:hypothetical protein
MDVSFEAPTAVIVYIMVHLTVTPYSLTDGCLSPSSGLKHVSQEIGRLQIINDTRVRE